MPGGLLRVHQRDRRHVVPDADEPVRILVGQGTEEHGVHHGEDRRGRADADRQRENDRGAEERGAREGPGRRRTALCLRLIDQIRGRRRAPLRLTEQRTFRTAHCVAMPESSACRMPDRATLPA